MPNIGGRTNVARAWTPPGRFPKMPTAQIGEGADVLLPLAVGFGCAVYDATRNLIWAVNYPGTSVLWSLDLGTEGWTDHGAVGFLNPSMRGVALWADDGEVVVVAHLGFTTVTSETVRYSMDTATWTTGLATIPTAVVSACVSNHGGASHPYLWVVGGQATGPVTVRKTQRYDVAGDSWAVLADVNTPGPIQTGTVIERGDGFLYLVDEINNHFRKYNISGDSWATLTGPASGGGGAAQVAADSILIAHDDASLNAYTPSTDTDGGGSWPTPPTPPSGYEVRAMVWTGTNLWVFWALGSGTTGVVQKYTP